MRIFRRILLVTVFLVIVGGAGGLLWKWHSLSRAPLVLTLQVNHQSEIEQVAGTPLFFSAFLSSSRSGPLLRIGSSGKPWYSHLSVELVEGEKSSPIKFSLLSKPYSVYFPASSSRHHLSTELYDGEEAVLDHVRTLYTAELGVSPEQTNQIRAGRYTATAVLVVPFVSPWRWHGRVVSNPVVINIQEGTTVGAAQNLNRLTESAEFYLRTGNFQQAYRFAVQLTEINPAAIYSYILLGDALNGLHRDEEALAAYDRALYLRSLQPHYEPPDYLLMRKYEVEQRLGSGRP